MDGKGRLPAEIVAALESGATVVTGNQRAARTLRRSFDRLNRELGRQSWQAPTIMAWDTWTAALWRQFVVEGHIDQLVLNRSQEHAVWLTVLEADEKLASLKTVDSLARMASEAWHLVSSYNGRRHLRRTAGGSSDTRAFQRWAQTFERLCRSENFVSESQVEEILSGVIQNNSVPGNSVRLPQSGILLVGFDALTPAQMLLIDTLRSAAIPVAELSLAVDAKSRLLAAAKDEQEELSAAARWIRAFLEQYPATRVAVVVPGLEAERSRIDRVFREILAPELEDIRASEESTPYEFSIGKPLSQEPMIATALDLLRWAAEPLPLERISSLLLSPYFSMTSEEHNPRAEFDAFDLRRTKLLQPELSLQKTILALLRSRRRTDLPHLLDSLQNLDKAAHRLPNYDARSHAEWAERMRSLLEAGKWGAGAGESSLEFQVRRKWESALDELATLDFDGVLVEYGDALSAVERITLQTIFALQSRETPVQVMGPLEAAGSTFDALWFLRGGELSWPMATGSNPLLPWSMQRELKMPGTDPEQDTKYARRMSERIANSAETVIFSYAIDCDENRQRPSSALATLQLEEIDAKHLVSEPEPRTVIALEEIEDTAQIQTLPDQPIRGGARVLQLQASCGFRAFAEQRLWATGLESPDPGMDARESGTVIHKVLEIFWDQVKTQEVLKSMTAEERDDMLDWSIAQALQRAEQASATAWEKAYIDMQHERLHRLLLSWLEVELERALPFEVKLSEKEFKDVQVGPLRLSVRMDRVDLVEGGEVLIDYKTGMASPDNWLTERPDAPQLPLYAILSDPAQLQGVAFGLVRPGEGRAWKGYAAFDGVLPKPARLKEAATLEAQVVRWRQVLVALAEEFSRGDARVRPKQYPTTCRNCGQRLLCRLDAASLEQAGEEDGADATEADRD